MAITQYAQPAQAEFINTYVPIPFEQMAQAAMLRQEKHEQGLATEQEVLTSLGDLKYMEEVRDPYSGQMVNTGDKQRAEGFVQEIENEIENLSRVTPDRSTPEWKQLASGVISKVRKARGSSGVLGRIENRYNTINKMRADTRESGLSGHNLLGVNKDMARYIASMEGGEQEGSLSYTGAITPQVDRIDALYKKMDKMEPSTFVEYARASGDPELAGMTETKLAEGIPYELAYNAAMRNIEDDPTIGNDLAQEAEYMVLKGQAEDVQSAYKKLTEDLAKTAATTYQSYKVNKLQLGQLPSESGKKRSDIPVGFDFSKETTVTYRPEVLDPAKLQKNIGSLQQNTENLEKRDAYFREKYDIDEFKQGWPKDAEGNRITENEDGTPATPINLSAEFASIEQGILRDTQTIQEYENLDRKIKESIPIGTGEEVLRKEAKHFYEGAKMGLNPFEIRSSEGMFKGNAIAGSKNTMDLIRSAKEMSEEDFVELVMQDKQSYLSGTREYGKKYKEFYEDMSEPYTLNTIEYQMSDDFAEAHPLIGSLSTSAGSFESADVDVKDMGTGKSLSEIGKSEFERYDFSKSKAKSFFFDKESKTKVSVIYTVPPNENSDDPQQGSFRAPAPREFHAILKEQFPNDKRVELMIKEQLNDTVYNSKDKEGTTSLGLTTGVDDKGNVTRDVLEFFVSAPISPKKAGEQKESGEPIAPLHYNATVTFPDGTKRQLTGITESDLMEQMYNTWNTAQTKAMERIATSLKSRTGSRTGSNVSDFLKFK